MSPTPSKAKPADLAKCCQVAQLIKLVAEPSRLRVVLSLGRDEVGPGELAETVGVGSMALASHLGLLRAGGLVESDRGGGGRGSVHRLTDRGRLLLSAIEPLTTRV